MAAYSTGTRAVQLRHRIFAALERNNTMATKKTTTKKAAKKKAPTAKKAPAKKAPAKKGATKKRAYRKFSESERARLVAGYQAAVKRREGGKYLIKEAITRANITAFLKSLSQ